MNNNPPLTDTLPVRLESETDRKIKSIAKATGLTKSAIMRLAINHGLPLVEAGRIHMRPIPAVASV